MNFGVCYYHGKAVKMNISEELPMNNNQNQNKTQNNNQNQNKTQNTNQNSNQNNQNCKTGR